VPPVTKQGRICARLQFTHSKTFFFHAAIVQHRASNFIPLVNRWIFVA
jgi:hypothetical protein